MRGNINRLTSLLAILFTLGISTPAGALPLLSHHGRWITDPQGRVVILHGLQIDHYEPMTTVESINLSPERVPFIESQGFNALRVSIAYAGVEPQMGHFDDAYVQQYLDFDAKLNAAGIYDLLDMMQGQYAARFEGAGFPDWMVVTDGAPNQPGPFPQSYLYDPAEERAWDNFWANTALSDGVGLQDHYANGLRHLARKFAADPAFAGFDLLNEPWSGSQYPTCANPAGCPVFDMSLNAFYQRIIPALRKDDPTHLVFYEPHALFDQGANTNLGPIGDPNAVFTFHNYCLGDQPGLPQSDPGQNCGINEQIVLNNADAQAAKGNDALLEDEWGNTASVPLDQRMVAEADQHMEGQSYWAYQDCCNSAGALIYDATKPPTGANLNEPVLDALVEPYPQAIAGTPTSFNYDPTNDTFNLNYQARLLDGGPAAGLQTEIFVPRRHYPTGYRVQMTGASVVSTPTAGILRICNPTTPEPVTVTVTPDTGSSTDLPDATQAATTCPAAQQSTSATGSPYTVSAGGGHVAVAGIAGIALPQSTRCLSRRRFAVHARLHSGTRLLLARVTVNGHRTPVRITHHTMLTAVVDLRGLPRGPYRVRIVLRVLRSGHATTITIIRTFHTCLPGHRT